MSESKRYCGAKAKSTGKPCKLAPLLNGRCKFHGGMSTGPSPGSQNNLTHGIYAQGLTDEEQKIWDSIELGKVDDEIKFCRIQLRRAVIAQKKSLEAGESITEGFELSEIKQQRQANGRSSTEVIKKRPDYRQIIDRLLGRIGKLEETKARLMLMGAGGDDPLEFARKIHEALKEIDKRDIPSNA
jgi:hypothetical protein